MVDKRAALVDRLDTAREQFELQYIIKALERTKDNKTEAAKLLGLSRKALWEKCKRCGISKAANGANGDGECARPRSGGPLGPPSCSYVVARHAVPDLHPPNVGAGFIPPSSVSFSIRAPRPFNLSVIPVSHGI